MKRTVVASMLAIAALAAMGGATAQDEDEQYSFAYGFRPGAILRYSTQVAGTGTFDVSAVPELPALPAMKISMSAALRQKVAGVADDGTATIANQIEKMVMEQVWLGAKLRVEVTPKGVKATVNGKPAPRGEMPSVKNIPGVGKPLMLKMRPTGEIVEVADADAKQLAELAGETGFGQFGAFNEVLGIGAPIFPDYAVTVGEVWEPRLSLALSPTDPDMRLDAQTTFRLEKIGGTAKERLARLSFSSWHDLSALVAGPGTALPGGGSMRVDRASEQSRGETLWSLDRGLVTRSDFEDTGDVTMVISADGQTVPMNMTMALKGSTVLKP